MSRPNRCVWPSIHLPSTADPSTTNMRPKALQSLLRQPFPLATAHPASVAAPAHLQSLAALINWPRYPVSALRTLTIISQAQANKLVKTANPIRYDPTLLAKVHTAAVRAELIHPDHPHLPLALKELQMLMLGNQRVDGLYPAIHKEVGVGGFLLRRLMLPVNLASRCSLRDPSFGTSRRQ